jgi:hypothetical protein
MALKVAGAVAVLEAVISGRVHVMAFDLHRGC